MVKWLTFLVLISFISISNAKPVGYHYAEVTRVIDGDTFEMSIQLGFEISIMRKVRVLDLDTPETWRPSNELERFHGEIATSTANELLKGRRIIIKINTPRYYDSFGRVLAEVWLDEDTCYADEMLKRNLSKFKSYD